MPTLNWIGKDKVVNHHQDVPYKILEKQYTFADGKESKDGSSPKVVGF
jgi:adenine-specific DNA-methyltransferase